MSAPDQHDPRHGDGQEPVLFRPRRLRTTVQFFGLVLCAGCAAVWVLMPATMRATFNAFQIITLLLILVGMLFTLLAIGACSVCADSEGLQVRNGVRTHRIEWGGVHKILLRPGDPWALALIMPTDGPFEVDLDAEKLQLMGIQASDGPYAQQAVEELRRRHEAYRAQSR